MQYRWHSDVVQRAMQLRWRLLPLPCGRARMRQQHLRLRVVANELKLLCKRAYALASDCSQIADLSIPLLGGRWRSCERLQRMQILYGMRVAAVVTAAFKALVHAGFVLRLLAFDHVGP
jgi:hypothetical protein